MSGNVGEGIAAISQYTAMRIGLPVLHAYVVDEVFCVVAVGAVDDEVVVGDDGGGSEELGDFDYAAVASMMKS